MLPPLLNSCTAFGSSPRQTLFHLDSINNVKRAQPEASAFILTLWSWAHSLLMVIFGTWWDTRCAGSLSLMWNSYDQKAEWLYLHMKLFSMAVLGILSGEQNKGGLHTGQNRSNSEQTSGGISMPPPNWNCCKTNWTAPTASQGRGWWDKPRPA